MSQPFDIGLNFAVFFKSKYYENKYEISQVFTDAKTNYRKLFKVNSAFFLYLTFNDYHNFSFILNMLFSISSFKNSCNV